MIAFYLENTANYSGGSQRYFSLAFHHTPFQHGQDVHPEREGVAEENAAATERASRTCGEGGAGLTLQGRL